MTYSDYTEYSCTFYRNEAHGELVYEPDRGDLWWGPM